MKMALMNVVLLNSMGSDLDVVNTARVSFDKKSTWENEGFNEPYYLSTPDTKLISYLAKYNHWSPFSHCMASFHIKAPIFVARQLQKHTVGLAWNEVSRRYVDSDPEFYIPEELRGRAENVKQGSGDVLTGMGHAVIHMMDNVGISLTHYKSLLSQGVCPEQARMVLPQSTMTEWVWTGSLYAFARVCKLRLDSHTQQETQEVAKMISKDMQKLFPVSWDALMMTEGKSS